MTLECTLSDILVDISSSYSYKLLKQTKVVAINSHASCPSNQI